MATYTEYPKWLHHPGYRPAVISDDLAPGPDGRPRYADAPPGRPAQLPPVMVNSPDQEEYYVAKGYAGSVVTEADKKAWESRQVAPKPPGFVQRDYPYYAADGTLVQDPNAPPPPDPNYPKWVTLADGTSVVARDAAHERELIPPPEPSEAEREFWQAIAAVDDKGALAAKAEAMGIKVDKRWSATTLKGVLEGAV